LTIALPIPGKYFLPRGRKIHPGLLIKNPLLQDIFLQTHPSPTTKHIHLLLQKTSRRKKNRTVSRSKVCLLIAGRAGWTDQGRIKKTGTVRKE